VEIVQGNGGRLKGRFDQVAAISILHTLVVSDARRSVIALTLYGTAFAPRGCRRGAR